MVFRCLVHKCAFNAETGKGIKMAHIRAVLNFLRLEDTSTLINLNANVLLLCNIIATETIKCFTLQGFKTIIMSHKYEI